MQKYGSSNYLHCPALWFPYILMPGKEELVLVQLSFQHNSEERPISPMFPDYLFVSCDCVQIFYDNLIFINLATKLIIITFPVNIEFILFSFYCIFYPKFCLICLFFHFLLQSASTIFSLFMSFIFITYVNGAILITFQITKNFFKSIWSVILWKNIFKSQYSYRVTNFKFIASTLILNSKINLSS